MVGVVLEGALEGLVGLAGLVEAEVSLGGEEVGFGVGLVVVEGEVGEVEGLWVVFEF